MDERCACGDFYSEHDPPGLFSTWPGRCRARAGTVWECGCPAFFPHQMAGA